MIPIAKIPKTGQDNRPGLFANEYCENYPSHADAEIIVLFIILHLYVMT